MSTLLVSDSRWTWREHLKDSGAEYVCLDPGNADTGPPCRTFRHDGEKTRDWCFSGTTEAVRDPLRTMAAAWRLTADLKPDANILMASPYGGPLARQLALSIAQLLKPKKILVPEGSELESLSWPIGAETVPLPASLPKMVLESQRRARWLELFERAETHTIDLSQVAVEGTRIGSGRKVSLAGWTGWAEATGNTLHLVGQQELDEDKVPQYLDQSHMSRLNVVAAEQYEGLCCSVATQEGEDFGFGTIQKFLPERSQFIVLCDAVAPAPARILKIGSMRIDGLGREMGHADLKVL